MCAILLPVPTATKDFKKRDIENKKNEINQVRNDISESKKKMAALIAASKILNMEDVRFYGPMKRRRRSKKMSDERQGAVADILAEKESSAIEREKHKPLRNCDVYTMAEQSRGGIRNTASRIPQTDNALNARCGK